MLQRLRSQSSATLFLLLLGILRCAAGNIVRTPEELAWALNAGTDHVIVQRHLDMRTISPSNREPSRQILAQTKSLTGFCAEPMPSTGSNLFGVHPTNQQCVIIMPHPSVFHIDWKAPGASLWMHNLLFVVAPVGGNNTNNTGTGGGRRLLAEPSEHAGDGHDHDHDEDEHSMERGILHPTADNGRMWMSRVTFLGSDITHTAIDGGAHNTHFYMDSVEFHGFVNTKTDYHVIHPFSDGSVVLQNCSFTGNQSPSLVHVGGGFALLQDSAFGVDQTPGRVVVTYWDASPRAQGRVFSDELVAVSNANGGLVHSSTFTPQMPGDVRTQMLTLQDPWIVETVKDRSLSKAASVALEDSFTRSFVENFQPPGNGTADSGGSSGLDSWVYVIIGAGATALAATAIGLVLWRRCRNPTAPTTAINAQPYSQMQDPHVCESCSHRTSACYESSQGPQSHSTQAELTCPHSQSTIGAPGTTQTGTGGPVSLGLESIGAGAGGPLDRTFKSSFRTSRNNSHGASPSDTRSEAFMRSFGSRVDVPLTRDERSDVDSPMHGMVGAPAGTPGAAASPTSASALLAMQSQLSGNRLQVHESDSLTPEVSPCGQGGHSSQHLIAAMSGNSNSMPQSLPDHSISLAHSGMSPQGHCISLPFMPAPAGQQAQHAHHVQLAQQAGQAQHVQHLQHLQHAHGGHEAAAAAVQLAQQGGAAGHAMGWPAASPGGSRRMRERYPRSLARAASDASSASHGLQQAQAALLSSAGSQPSGPGAAAGAFGGGSGHPSVGHGTTGSTPSGPSATFSAVQGHRSSVEQSMAHGQLAEYGDAGSQQGRGGLMRTRSSSNKRARMFTNSSTSGSTVHSMMQSTVHSSAWQSAINQGGGVHGSPSEQSSQAYAPSTPLVSTPPPGAAAVSGHAPLQPAQPQGSASGPMIQGVAPPSSPSTGQLRFFDPSTAWSTGTSRFHHSNLTGSASVPQSTSTLSKGLVPTGTVGPGRRPAAQGTESGYAADASEIPEGSKTGHDVHTHREWLEDELDRLYAEQELFLGIYEVLSAVERRAGAQGVVQFMRSVTTNEEFAAKFFLRRDGFAAEAALYNNPVLRNMMPATCALLDNDAGHLQTTKGYVLPPCIIIERGESLHEWAEREEPDYVTAFQVLYHVVERLVALHKSGWVHRDIKPANILRRPRKHAWTLIDFGCAARIGTQVEPAFTIEYAAPEVAQAVTRGDKIIKVDAAVDMWALGVIAFELLTDTLAFDPGEVSERQVWEQLCGYGPLPWEEKAAGSKEKVGQLRALKRGVLACLSRDPSMRPPAEALLASWSHIFDNSTRADAELAKSM